MRPRPVSFGAPIELTLGWNGEKMTIPGPAILPPWFEEGARYRLWQRRHNIQTLSTMDGQGNTYEVSLLGAAYDRDGVLHEMINSVSVYRPDGTLAASTSFTTFGVAGWGIMEQRRRTDPCRRATILIHSPPASPGLEFRFLFFVD